MKVPGILDRMDRVHRYLDPKHETLRIDCGVEALEPGVRPLQRFCNRVVYTLNYVISGTGAYHDNQGRSLPLEPGSFFSHFPRDPHELHFSDLFTFSKRFKAQTGRSPQAFRAQRPLES